MHKPFLGTMFHHFPKFLLNHNEGCESLSQTDVVKVHTVNYVNMMAKGRLTKFVI